MLHDLDVVIWLQDHGNGVFDALAHALNFAGLTWFFLLTLTLVYWSIDKNLGRRLLLALLFEMLLIFALKSLFNRPRPYEFPGVALLFSDEPAGQGFPSGHAAIAVLFWGILVMRLGRRWLWAVLMVYVLMSGWARMYGGAHFPQDVIAGWLIGFVLLLIFPSLADRFPGTWNRLPVWGQFALVTGIGVVAVALAWNDEDALTVSAGLLGGGVGLLVEFHYIGFRIMGDWQRRALVYVAGMLLVGVAFVGMRVAFAELDPPQVFRVIRYGITALIASAIYPWVLTRLPQ
jgi:membrane-associated phospholipid phosphatase